MKSPLISVRGGSKAANTVDSAPLNITNSALGSVTASLPLLPVNGQRLQAPWPLAPGHVGVDIARVDVVDDDVLPLVLSHLSLLDPAEGAQAHLGRHVGRRLETNEVNFLKFCDKEVCSFQMPFSIIANRDKFVLCTLSCFGRRYVEN